MTKAMITQARLRELFHYDEQTGDFTWKKSRGAVRAGDIAGCDNGIGYRSIGVDMAKHYSHRLAWIYVYGEIRTQVIDHINGDGCDNRISNLRAISQSENCKNRRINKTGKSGFLGVAREYGRWRALIYIDKKPKILGRFDRLSDAVKARVDAEIGNGYHANHGCDRQDLTARQV